jgi:dihydroorotase
MVAQAQERGASITAEAAAHHLVLTDEDVSGFDTSAKVNPPLRSEENRLALIEGIRSGVIGAITSDHVPQSSLEKDVTFARADFGAIGLQTVVPAALQLIEKHQIEPLTVIGCLTSGPAAILGLSAGSLAKGSTADITIIDPDATWEFTPELNASKSENSPFLGKSLKGRVLKTIAKGKVVFTV